MNQNPLVSVIIPTYNRANMLRQAVDSVLEQDYRPAEVLVIDDGSVDETPAVLAEYADRIRRFRRDNAGVSAARNTGIRAARGELIAFLDSDDYWLPGKLTAQVEWFLRHPENMICQTEEIWVRNGRRVNPRQKHRKRAGDIFIASLSLCLVSPSAVMLRRRLLDETGLFDPELPACEDYDLWLRVSSRYRVGLIEKPLLVRRGGHPGQLSAAPGLDRYRIHAIRKILDAGDLSLAQRKAAVSALEKKCAIYAAGCEKRAKHEEAARYRMIADALKQEKFDSPGSTDSVTGEKGKRCLHKKQAP